MSYILKHFLALVLLVVQIIADERICIPHDIQPGYSIKKLHSKGQVDLEENEISSHFTVLNDGSLVPTKSLSHLADNTVKLRIREEHDGVTFVQPLLIHVRKSEEMLHFPRSSYNGKIDENEPPNTVLANLVDLKPTDAKGNVEYSVFGSEDFNVFKHEGHPVIASSAILDREKQSNYVLKLNAVDSNGCIASVPVTVIVNDLNDNPPIFLKKHYMFKISSDIPAYSSIGFIRAVDADGDKPVYEFVETNHNHTFVIVPQTGRVIVMGDAQPGIYSFYVQANDNRYPPLYSDIIPVTVSVGNVQLEHKLKRTKRSIRQTKTYTNFLETDANMPGKVMFRLESLHPDETFSLEDENRWIAIDHNGDVKVREPWDYEQLESEKTIDFWVRIKAPHQPGKTPWTI